MSGVGRRGGAIPCSRCGVQALPLLAHRHLADDDGGLALCGQQGYRYPRRAPASVLGVEFSRELRNDVLAGDITLSVRLWQRPQVKQGGRYRVGLGQIEIDAIELFGSRRSPMRTSGEPASPTARRCAVALRTPGRLMRTRSSTGSSSTRCDAVA